MAADSSLTVIYGNSLAEQQTAASGWDATYRWILGWIVAIVILSLLNRTRLGHVLIYYWLWMLLLFLFITQYKFIVAALGPIGEPVPGSEGGGT